jgi:5'-nucleotidase
MRPILSGLAAAALILPLPPATARNIVLTNDDGLTSNVLALYRALKADGHDVIVAVPCANQSGMGAAAYFSRPVAPLTAPCRNGSAVAGDPGAGPMTRSDLPAHDFHYVSGTPVMAMLYGVDVAGSKRWGKAPDLVLSGPNEGQNVGAIILSSGTVSNAQYAAVRGIPAIALSAGGNSTGTETLDNPVSRIVAAQAVKLVGRLDRQARGKPMLPAGIALNVNFPDNPDGAEWRLSRIGTYNAYDVRFSENMARDASPSMIAMARQHGASVPELPGIAIDMNAVEPSPGQRDDESIVYRSAIAVSPMRAGYDAGTMGHATLRKLLRTLVTSGKQR